MKAETIELIIIGIVASNMGYADQSKVCATGHEIYKYIGKLTYNDLREIKKQLKKSP